MRLTPEERQWLAKIEKQKEEIRIKAQTPLNVFLLSYGLLRLKKKMLRTSQQWFRLKRRRIAKRNRLQAYEDELFFKRKKKLKEEADEAKKKVPPKLIKAYLEKLDHFKT